MEELPQIADAVRLPVEITIRSYFLDHHVEGQAVLPAVEALQLLAVVVKGYRPETDVGRMVDAHFDKFLFIPPGKKRITAEIDIEVYKNTTVTARLLTRTRSGKSSITRVKEHARVCYPDAKPDPAPLPLDLNSALEGICAEISAEEIYKQLVPFGPAYHNIKGPLYISEAGATAEIIVPQKEVRGALGSPFVLDAAFHAACVWSQRFAQTVAFPTGFERRIITRPTLPGETYFGWIFPAKMDSPRLDFDIGIYDKNGSLFEFVAGVHMRDVSAGRMKPPQWIVDKENPKSFKNIRESGCVFSVIELDTLMPFAAKVLSKQEQIRFQKMGTRRKRSYLAARMACKRVSRTLSGNDMRTPAAEITTVCADGVLPCCPHTDGSLPAFCSVSHDDRFAIAVASGSQVGVDVEVMSGRVLKSQRLFMKPSEQDLVRESPLGETESAIKIWSIKEAAAKALQIPLADAWHRVAVLDVGESESRLRVDERQTYSAFHDIVGPHIFTLLGPLPE
jgi:phosphopantetheinyl transferase